MHPTHRLELSVTGEPAVLDRVVTVCRLRRCTIVSLHFEAPDRHRPGRLSLGFSADARRAQLATEHLAGLVDVLAVGDYSSSRKPILSVT